ncbi:MAG: histidine phosphatase family protein [Actinobacteria bacterium]|nr:histidine phosphatase family protein [Actinomycetota bacterium]
MLHLVRHAKAGSRSVRAADELSRPLTQAGRTQALAVAERLSTDSLISRSLISSPSLRCVQTLEPLAAQIGGAVVVDERLAEGARFEGALLLLASVPDGSVLCSHGDVIPATIDALVRRGCEIIGEPDWRKASVWLLRRGDDGDIVEATAWPPPLPA